VRTFGLVLLAVCVLVPVAAEGFQYIVRQDGTGHFLTITEALEVAEWGDRIWVWPGTYAPSTGETMPLVMKSGVILEGQGLPWDNIIDAEGQSRVMICEGLDSYTKVTRFTLTGGATENPDAHGAGMYLGDLGPNDSPDFSRLIFRDNHAERFGGGLYADSTTGQAVFNSCRFSNNTASSGGGVFSSGGLDPVGVVNSVFDGNSVTGYGGGLLIVDTGSEPDLSRDLIIQRLTFSGNSADLGGAAVSTYVSTRFWDTIIAFSESDTDPIDCHDGASVVLECCDVFGNAGGNYVGCIEGQMNQLGNFSANPIFCGVEYEPDDPYSLEVSSPCADENNILCDTVGARPVKCGIPWLHLHLEWLEYYIGFGGEEVCQYLIFENGGDEDLYWQLSAYEMMAGEGDSRGSGGPDAHGYRWVDSDEPGGPAFDWQDISSVGTQVTLGDDDATLVVLPFTFPFYDSNWFEIALSSNGYITFGSDWTASANGPIPDPSQPNEFIAPFWEDLDPSMGGTIHHHYSPDRGDFTIQFTEVPLGIIGVYGEYTFQVVLHEDGTILFKYLDMQGYTEGATIGIENIDGYTGLQVAYNEPYVHNDLVVRIDEVPPQPEWLSLGQIWGAMSPGQTEEVEVCVDAGGLDPGTYECMLVLVSNDYNVPQYDIPLTVEVFPTGVEEGPDARLSFPGNYPNPFNPKTNIVYDLPEPARVDLRVYDVAGRLVRVILDDAATEAGPHTAVWDGRDDRGARLASGVYLCRLEIDGEVLTKRMVLLK